MGLLSSSPSGTLFQEQTAKEEGDGVGLAGFGTGLDQDFGHAG
jgi:hypothetical protein